MNVTQEAQLRAEAARGLRANELMVDELMVQAFETLQKRLQDEWQASPARDTEGRERLWLMTKLLKNVADHLSEVAQTGKLASLQLEQHRTLVQRTRQWLKE